MNLICGINPVLEALGAGTRHFDRLLVVKGIRNGRVNEAITRASQKGVPLRFEARETLDRMSGGVPHQGVIAVVSPKPMISLEQLLAEARQPALLVVLDGVEDPRNLGAVLRTVECSGADGVVLPERHSAGLSESVARSSAGALEYVKVARVGNVAQAIEELKAKGLWVVGFDADGTERWDAVDLKQPTALVVGGEGRGIRRLVRERCDHLVSLPLFGHVTSLNVSVVAGVALYEVVRQRGASPSHVKPIPMKRWNAPEPIVGPGADDAEHDPGALASRSHAVREIEGEEDVHEEAPTTGLVDIHEESAWGGPTVVKHRDHDMRGDRRGGRHHRRDERGGARREEPPREPAPQAAGGGVPPAPGRENSGGKAGRRHRRRRGHGHPPGQGGPRPAMPEAQGGMPPRPESGGQGPASEPRTRSGEGSEGGGQGRRRRRRRRH